MPALWTGSASFSNSAAGASSVIASIPAGDYGVFPVVVFAVGAYSGGGDSGQSWHFSVDENPGALFYPNYFVDPGTENDMGIIAPGPDRHQGGVGGLVCAAVGDAHPVSAGWTLRILSSFDTLSDFGAGTADSTSGSPNVVGHGTAFTTFLAVGQRFRLHNQTKIVASITDDTHLAATTNFSSTSTFDRIYAGQTEVGAAFVAVVDMGRLPANFPSDPRLGFREDAVESNSADFFGTQFSNFGASQPSSFHQLEGFLDNATNGDFAAKFAVGVVGGYAIASGPYAPDLVNGNANWENFGHAENGHAYATLGLWNRPADGPPLDTSLAWSVPDAYGRENVIGLLDFPGSGKSRGRSQVIMVG